MVKSYDITVDIVKGKSKKTGKDYEAIKLSIGEWSSLVFPRSPFEMNYIKKVITANDNED